MRFSPDWWAFWAGVWAVGLTAAAATAGIVAWHFSNVAAAANDERARALELRVSQQQERAAKAEQDLIEVQQRFVYRSLTAEQGKILVNRMAKFRGQKMVLFAIAGSEEVFQYANQLEAAFTNAGLVVERRDGVKMGQYQGKGLSIESHGTRADVVNAMRPAFREAGILNDDAQLWISLVPNDLTLVVWPK